MREVDRVPLLLALAQGAVEHHVALHAADIGVRGLPAQLCLACFGIAWLLHLLVAHQPQMLVLIPALIQDVYFGHSQHADLQSLRSKLYHLRHDKPGQRDYPSRGYAVFVCIHIVAFAWQIAELLEIDSSVAPAPLHSAPPCTHIPSRPAGVMNLAFM